MRSFLLALGTFLVKAALQDLPDQDKLGLRMVALLVFLLEQAAAQTTNTVDDELVGQIKKHLEGDNGRGQTDRHTICPSTGHHAQ
jgi:hypothetical protein